LYRTTKDFYVKPRFFCYLLQEDLNENYLIISFYKTNNTKLTDNTVTIIGHTIKNLYQLSGNLFSTRTRLYSCICLNWFAGRPFSISSIPHSPRVLITLALYPYYPINISETKINQWRNMMMPITINFFRKFNGCEMSCTHDLGKMTTAAFEVCSILALIGSVRFPVLSFLGRHFVQSRDKRMPYRC